ncbi:MAG TPA: hypothetical protein VFD70_24740 [Anaerolineae bacterium]|nr:hypothetical protein [Anaerolineae bacterium]
MENSQPSIEPFLGVWELDPTQSNYEFGTPPQTGQYELVREGDALAVIMDWRDAAGKDFHMVYYAHPDGVEHPYTDSPAVDAIVTTLVDTRTLDTVSKKDGSVIARGRRALSEDGKTMFVTQSGKTPDGKPYNNYSVYHKA